jgi:hypothetical protein
MGVWQRVEIHSVKFNQGPPCPTFYALQAGLPARRAVGLQPSFIPLDTPRRTPMIVTFVLGARLPDQGRVVNQTVLRSV